MKASSIPAKFNIPFANSAGGSFIRTIPQPSQIGIQAGAASLTDGFPPVCFTPVGAGGTAPFGQDFNGLLKQSTSWDQWFSAGGPVFYDAAFQSAIGGYPNRVVVQSVAFPGLFWQSTADDNFSNPDAGGTNWIPIGGQPPVTVSGVSTTYTVAQVGSLVRRSNGGTLMTDTLPGTVPGQLPSASVLNVFNSDASAVLLVSAGVGSTLKGVLSYNNFVILGPGQSASFVSDGADYWIINKPDRINLSGNVTMYVSTTGSDTSNSGFSVGSPLASVQAAWNILLSHIDLNGFGVTVQIANGTYTAGLNALGSVLGAQGAFGVTFQGSSTPSDVTFSMTGIPAFQAGSGASFTIRGVKITGTGNVQGISALAGGVIQYSSNAFPIEFGAVPAGQHIISQNGGLVLCTGNYSVTGGALNHMQASGGGAIRANSKAINVSGSPAFTQFAAANVLGLIDVNGSAFAGAATGQRYGSGSNSVIFVNGAGPNVFPGSVAGATLTGGQYL